MSLRKTAAAVILGALVPVGVGAMLDPYEASWRRAWTRGALALCVIGAVAWAADELAPEAGT